MKNARILYYLPLLAVVVGFSSCTPGIKPAPPNVGMQATAQKPPASPALNDAKHKAGQADQQAAVSAAQLAKAQQNATEAQKIARAAKEEAARLVKQKMATEEDLRKQQASIDQLNGAMDRLEVDLAETAASLGKEKVLRAEGALLLDKAMDLVRDKEVEAETLRAQLKHASDQRDAYYQAADQNAKAAIEAQGKLEAAHGATRVWMKIALAAGLIAAILLIIFVIVPLARKSSIGI